MMPTPKRIAALLLVLVASAGIARAGEDKKPAVSLKGLAVERVDFTSQTADVIASIEIDNPGPSFKIKDVSYRIKLNGEHAAEGKYKDEIKVPQASKVVLDVPLAVSLSALPAITWNTIASGFTLRYELETQFTVPILAFFNHKVNTTIAGDLELADLFASMREKIKTQ